jgi:hypothetical protein
MTPTPSNLVPLEQIEKSIYLIRGKKVMLDRDLAELYGVATGALNQAVKRNSERFPSDFMFQLSDKEVENWMSQIVISNREKMGVRKAPYAFTELGIAMLSGVINSKKAIQVHIQIIRAFTRLRELLISHQDLKHRIEALEQKYNRVGEQVHSVFEAFEEIKLLLEPPPKDKMSKIGFV